MWPFSKKKIASPSFASPTDRMALEIVELRMLADERQEAAFRWQEKAHREEVEHARTRTLLDGRTRLIERLRRVASTSIDLSQAGQPEPRHYYAIAEVDGLSAEYESIHLALGSVRAIGLRAKIEGARAIKAIESLRELEKNPQVCGECSCAILVED